MTQEQAPDAAPSTMETRLQRLAEIVNEQKGHCAGNEQATKFALIHPFLRDILGFSPQNLNEVYPEYTADPGGGNSSKVDYALKINGEAVLVIEAKAYGESLDKYQKKQLAPYFHATNRARVAIITDGIDYRFFSDLVADNVMDAEPFFRFDVLNLTPLDIRFLEHFTKDEVAKGNLKDSVEHINRTLYERNRAHMMKRHILSEMGEPSLDLSKRLAQDSGALSGPFTRQSAKDQLIRVTAAAFQLAVEQKVAEAFAAAAAAEEAAAAAASAEVTPAETEAAAPGPSPVPEASGAQVQPRPESTGDYSDYPDVSGVYFSFLRLGIQRGDVLTYRDGTSVTLVTMNQVSFNGETMGLGSVVKSLTGKYTPDYRRWTFNGRTLHDLHWEWKKSQSTEPQSGGEDPQT